MAGIKYKNVALVVGGMGSERDVSLSTGKGFEQALIELGVNYQVIDAQQDFPLQLMQSGCDCVLLALHGKYAEDGVVQGVCEYLKIPYSGSGVLTSALCMNKLVTKQLFAQNGIPTPEFQLVDLKLEKLENAEIFIQAPCVVKPSREGSSVGVTICQSNLEVRAAIEEAAKYDHLVIIERFIKGVELTVPILEGKTLTPIEIEPKTRFYDYKNKYTEGATEYYLPARVDEHVIENLKITTEKIYHIFNINTYARVDYMLDENGKEYCIEINTLPGCTPTSLVPKAAKYDGISFNDFILKLINGARLDYEGLK